MRLLFKVLFNLVLLCTFFIVFYSYLNASSLLTQSDSDNLKFLQNVNQDEAHTDISTPVILTQNTIKYGFRNDDLNSYNVWCIFTKVKKNNVATKYKFLTMLTSLLERSSVMITLHVVTDFTSRSIANSAIGLAGNATKKYILVRFYDERNILKDLVGLMKSMQPHFSSKTGSYYSDPLFFISLGLHKIAPQSQERAVMVDIDTKFLADIALLFQHFDYFGNESLVGLAPELSPVYHHVLYSYRSRNKGTRLGTALSRGGFPGLNSGVILFRFDRLRRSQLYEHLTTTEQLKALTSKYSFKNHLGDQDFYTVVAMDHPELIHLLPCSWNHQLCEWWRFHGYRDVFNDFAQCNEPVKLYHGNCNTPIPQH